MRFTIGYVVIEDFASRKEVAALRQRAEELMEGFTPEHVTLFSTTSRVREMRVIETRCISGKSRSYVLL